MPVSGKIQVMCASHHKKKKKHESHQQMLKLLAESLVGSKIFTKLRLVINHKGENCNLTVTDSTK